MAAVLSAGVRAGCYGGGLGWPDRNEAYYHAYRACNGYPDQWGNHVDGRFEWVSVAGLVIL